MDLVYNNVKDVNSVDWDNVRLDDALNTIYSADVIHKFKNVEIRDIFTAESQVAWERFLDRNNITFDNKIFDSESSFDVCYDKYFDKIPFENIPLDMNKIVEAQQNRRTFIKFHKWFPQKELRITILGSQFCNYTTKQSHMMEMLEKINFVSNRCDCNCITYI